MNKSRRWVVKKNEEKVCVLRQEEGEGRKMGRGKVREMDEAKGKRK